MTFAAINLSLPIVLAVHNLDELYRHDSFIRTSYLRHYRKLGTRSIFRNTILALTLSVAALSILTLAYGNAALAEISKVATFALMLNGMSHCVVSLKQRRFAPGTLSAILIVLPYAAVVIYILRAKLGESFWSLLSYAAIGAIITLITILTYIGVGYGLSQITSKKESDDTNE